MTTRSGTGTAHKVFSVHDLISQAAAAMRDADQPAPVINNFIRLYREVIDGKTGVIEENTISSVQGIKTLQQLQDSNLYLDLGMNNLGRLAVIRLNGGLGSSMGMPNAKSLLKVRGELTFNDLMIQQLQQINTAINHTIPLIHMTSFRTDSDISEVMAGAGYTNPHSLPTTFTQHMHPKVYQDDLSLANEQIDENKWNPPGHGDIYAALLATGIAKKLLEAGIKYAFVANSDNLGATVAPEILGYLIHNHCPFLMETCRRTEADKKGGHLAVNKTTGQLLLREVAQAPTTNSGDVIPEFQDITRYNQFNTNSIWLDLEAVINLADLHDGCIPLPLIRNVKPVNPEDRTSRKAIQIETAMGAAIASFSKSLALEVPRDRFMPVKTNNDLLLVMSDWYQVTESGHIVVNQGLESRPAPQINLDSKFFGMIGDFQSRIKYCPSLKHASRLEVIGDWTFDQPVTVIGDVKLIGTPGGVHKVSELGSVLESQTYTM
jgi:UTP--glucose-1-phosphate uridylyltransferase